MAEIDNKLNLSSSNTVENRTITAKFNEVDEEIDNIKTDIDNVISQEDRYKIAEVDNKVDKVDGKTLSSNDFTDTYKSKIDNGIRDVDNKLDSVSTNPIANNVVSNVVNSLFEKIDKIPTNTDSLSQEDRDKIDSIKTPDTLLDSNSDNSVANKAITKKFEEIRGNIIDINNNIANIGTGDGTSVIVDTIIKESSNPVSNSAINSKFNSVDGSISDLNKDLTQLSTKVDNLPAENSSEQITELTEQITNISASLKDKADSKDIPSDFYTQKEVDDKIGNISSVTPTDVYTKSEVDDQVTAINTILDDKLDKKDVPTDFYNKSEVDSKITVINTALGDKLDKKDVPTDFYNKSEVDSKVTVINTALGDKLDKKDVPTDFYNKSEVDSKVTVINNKIDGLDIPVVDDELKEDSLNPVSNSVINNKLVEIQQSIQSKYETSDGAPISVDTEFDNESANVLINSTITKKFTDVDKDIEDIKTDINDGMVVTGLELGVDTNEEGEVSVTLNQKDKEGQLTQISTTSPFSTGSGDINDLKLGIDTDEEGKVSVILNNKDNILSQTDYFAGGSGGGTVIGAIKLTSNNSARPIKVGDSFELNCLYENIASEGNIGDYTITIVYDDKTPDKVIKGAINDKDNIIYTFNSPESLHVGSNKITLSVVDDTNNTIKQSKQWVIEVVELSLTSSFNWSNYINKGDIFEIPVTIQGDGVKTVECYIDGVKLDDDKTASGTNSTVTFNNIKTDDLEIGSHSVQVRFWVQISGHILYSNMLYYDVAIADPNDSDNKSVIFMTKFEYADGSHILTSDEIPTITTKKYSEFKLLYNCYNPATNNPNIVSLYKGNEMKSQATDFNIYHTYTERLYESGTLKYTLISEKENDTVKYPFNVKSVASDMNISEPGNSEIKLSAIGKTNNDSSKEVWENNGYKTTFENFHWTVDGWLDNALKLVGTAKATINYQPFSGNTDKNSLIIKYKIDDSTDDNTVVMSSIDPSSGAGFEITPTKISLITNDGNVMSMLTNPGDEYEVAFVSFPLSTSNSSEYEKLNSGMIYLYINGIMSGGYHKINSSTSVSQASPQDITIGSQYATTNIYMIRGYKTYLTDSQVLDCYILDLDEMSDVQSKYEENNILTNGEITIDSVQDDMRYIVVTGEKDGLPVLLQAAKNNSKKTYFDADEILIIKRNDPSHNLKVIDGSIRLQGTSSLAYPMKNYRIYTKNSVKDTQLYLGCDENGENGVLQEGDLAKKYSFMDANESHAKAAPVDCFCLKADYAESSSSSNTGFARLINDALMDAGEYTPVQKVVEADEDRTYPYDVRTTINGEPCMLFYRKTVNDAAKFLGKFNFNNDKSTASVFGFEGVDAYYGDQDIIDYANNLPEDEKEYIWEENEDGVFVKTDKIRLNPTECWEFKNNSDNLANFLNADFDSENIVTDKISGEISITPNWHTSFESRFPDDDDSYEPDNTLNNVRRKPLHLMKVAKWINSTMINDNMTDEEKTIQLDKFKNELGDYFDVDYLCDYYVITQMFGCVDQMVKNSMIAFFYDPEKKKKLGYYIFYDNDTIMGVRNDGALVFDPYIDRQSKDPTNNDIYAYAGHDSVLWNNLEASKQGDIQKAYIRLRDKLTTPTIFEMFDDEQSAKFCERVYNIDALQKYIRPITEPIYTFDKDHLSAMQGSREPQRHWWLTNRFAMSDAKYATADYLKDKLSFKAQTNKGINNKMVITTTKDYYVGVQVNTSTSTSEVTTYSTVGGEDFNYQSDGNVAIGDVHYLYGLLYIDKLDMSEWNGMGGSLSFKMPNLTTLKLGNMSGTVNNSDSIDVTQAPKLEVLVINNYNKITSLDLTNNRLLKKLDLTGCVALTSISLAQGCEISDITLPSNIKILKLKSLPEITRTNMHFDDYKDNLTSLYIDDCPKLDGLQLFKDIFSDTNNTLTNIRITGVDMKGDGSDLQTWMSKSSLKGLDNDGQNVSYISLVGKYQLTKYLSDEEFSSLRERFAELSLMQPQYTMIEFDEYNNTDSNNIINLDNNTGYNKDIAYTPSAHVKAILDARHRVLGKITGYDEDTKQYIASIHKLHDDNSFKYDDNSTNINLAQDANLDGTEGNVFVYEPRYWYKGINDFNNDKKYICYSKNAKVPDSPATELVKSLTYQDISNNSNIHLGSYIDTTKTNYDDMVVIGSGYGIAEVDVEDYKEIRFSTVVGTDGKGAMFVDDEKNIIGTVCAAKPGLRFVDGMYIIEDIPEGATKLIFTFNSSKNGSVLLYNFDDVVLSKTGKIEDMEPKWVLSEETLVGVFKTSVIGSKLYSVAVPNKLYNETYTNLINYSSAQHLQLLDYETHKNISNLVLASVGDKNSQYQFGWDNTNSASNGYDSRYKGIVGQSASLGMKRTYSNDYINDTTSLAEETVYNDALIGTPSGNVGYFKLSDGSYTPSGVTNMLGYEDFFNQQEEILDKATLTSYSNIFEIERPDGTINYIDASQSNQGFMVAGIHGRYADVFPIGNNKIGTSDTYYCDYISFTTDGYGEASHLHTVGEWASSSGVPKQAGLFAKTSRSDNNNGTGICSRLMFKGIINNINVETYKNIEEI